MSDNRNTGVAILGVGGLIAAAAAIINARKADAAPSIPNGNGGEIILDQAASDLLLAIAQSDSNIDANTKTLIELVRQLSASQGVDVGMKNPSHIMVVRLSVNATNAAYSMPDRPIPYKKNVVIKALPTNLGVIYVANSAVDATNINSAYPLIANEAVEYEIDNLQRLHYSGSIVGDGLVATVEQESG